MLVFFLVAISQASTPSEAMAHPSPVPPHMQNGENSRISSGTAPPPSLANGLTNGEMEKGVVESESPSAKSVRWNTQGKEVSAINKAKSVRGREKAITRSG